MHPAVAARLRPADVADLVERLVYDRSNPLCFLEARARLRVEIDAQLVGAFGVAAP